MKLSERRQKAKEEHQKLTEVKVAHAKKVAMDLINSDQYAISALSLPDAQLAITDIVTETIRAINSPINDFLDVLRAKGFRQAEIRRIVHKCYDLYCNPINSDSGRQALYDDMLPEVAAYFLAHQEAYTSLSTDELRDE